MCAVALVSTSNSLAESPPTLAVASDLWKKKIESALNKAGIKHKVITVPANQLANTEKSKTYWIDYQNKPHLLKPMFEDEANASQKSKTIFKTTDSVSEREVIWLGQGSEVPYPEKVVAHWTDKKVTTAKEQEIHRKLLISQKSYHIVIWPDGTIEIYIPPGFKANHAALGPNGFGPEESKWNPNEGAVSVAFVDQPDPKSGWHPTRAQIESGEVVFDVLKEKYPHLEDGDFIPHSLVSRTCEYDSCPAKDCGWPFVTNEGRGAFGLKKLGPLDSYNHLAGFGPLQTWCGHPKSCKREKCKDYNQRCISPEGVCKELREAVYAGQPADSRGLP